MLGNWGSGIDRSHCGSGCVSRWECSQLAGWVDSTGCFPWGENGRHAQLVFLASASASEAYALAEAAFLNLDTGAWQGCSTTNGGWVDGQPPDDAERAWRKAARDFYERCRAGDSVLTEGLIAFATLDLACELAWLRGWCPD